MPYPYEHLSRTEREQIAVRRRQGASRRLVGRELGRSASTIGREIGRNGQEDGSYLAGRADERAQERRHRPRRQRKLAGEGLRTRVEGGLRAYWSPEQISGRQAVRATGTHADGGSRDGVWVLRGVGRGLGGQGVLRSQEMPLGAGAQREHQPAPAPVLPPRYRPYAPQPGGRPPG